MPYINLQSNSIYYERRGPASGNTLAIFFNGWCLSARYWEETIRLIEKEQDVLLFDGTGFGRSQAGFSDNSSTTIESSAAEVWALLSALKLNEKKSYHVIGHSLGGVTASRFAAQAEAKNQLASLTVVNSGSFGPEAKQGNTLDVFVNIFVRTKRLYDLPLLRRAVVARSVNRPISDWATRVITGDFVQANPKAALEISRSSLADSTLRLYRRELEQLKAPLLLIVGDKDATIPPQGMYNIKRFKLGSQLAAFPDCGHLPMLEDSKAFANTLLEFFRANVPVGGATNQG